MLSLLVCVWASGAVPVSRSQGALSDLPVCWSALEKGEELRNTVTLLGDTVVW